MRTTFKDTKIGRIPEEWEVTTIDGILANKKNAIVDGPFGSNMKNSDYVDSGTPVLQGKNITGNKFVWSDIRYISCEKAQELARSKVVVGDILVVKIGSIGYSALIDTLHGFENAVIPANLLKISVNEEVYSKSFLLQYLWDEKTVRRLQNSASQTAQPALSLKAVKRFKIVKPPLPEQRKIAEILSTVDETIEKTDAVIRETQQLKKGLMQKLFTEGIRHSRFKETKIGQIPGEWEVVRLAKVSEIRFSNVNKKSYPGEISVHLCNYLDVYNNEYIDEKIDFMEATATTAEIEKFSLNKGDVIITKDSETADDIAVPSVVIEELNNVLCGYHLALLQPNVEKVNGIFLSKLLSSTPINNQFVRLAQGLTRFGLNVSSIQNAIIPLPSLDEQHQIAQILSEVDLKTEREQAFKEELEQLKKGLMQVLLTGKVRVKV